MSKRKEWTDDEYNRFFIQQALRAAKWHMKESVTEYVSLDDIDGNIFWVAMETALLARVLCRLRLEIKYSEPNAEEMNRLNDAIAKTDKKMMEMADLLDDVIFQYAEKDAPIRFIAQGFDSEVDPEKRYKPFAFGKLKKR